MHRPESKTQANAIHMSTLILKVFPNIKAVSQERINLLPKSPVEIPSMKFFITNNMHNVSKTYAESMPDWVVAKYFNPESECQRLLVHDYQQTEVEEMRRMDNTKLVDSIELPLKSCENVLTAANKMLSGGLQLYLDHFIAPFVGDWPMQFFI
jgi:TFIIF-interacting CTD phosphatase-like protein